MDAEESPRFAIHSLRAVALEFGARYVAAAFAGDATDIPRDKRNANAVTEEMNFLNRVEIGTMASLLRALHRQPTQHSITSSLTIQSLKT